MGEPRLNFWAYEPDIMMLPLEPFGSISGLVTGSISGLVTGSISGLVTESKKYMKKSAAPKGLALIEPPAPEAPRSMKIFGPTELTVRSDGLV